jgi:hypothetical protein
MVGELSENPYRELGVLLLFPLVASDLNLSHADTSLAPIYCMPTPELQTTVCSPSRPRLIALQEWLMRLIKVGDGVCV